MQIIIVDGDPDRRKSMKQAFWGISDVDVFDACMGYALIGAKWVSVPNILDKMDKPTAASVLENSGIVLRHFRNVSSIPGSDPLPTLCGELTVYYGGHGGNDPDYTGGRCPKSILHELIWRPVASDEKALTKEEATKLIQWVKEKMPLEKKPAFLGPPATLPLSFSLNILCQGYLSVYDAEKNGKGRSSAVAKALHVMKWDALHGDQRS